MQRAAHKQRQIKCRSCRDKMNETRINYISGSEWGGASSLSHASLLLLIIFLPFQRSQLLLTTILLAACSISHVVGSARQCASASAPVRGMSNSPTVLRHIVTLIILDLHFENRTFCVGLSFREN